MNSALEPTPTDWTSDAMQRRIRRRYGAERRFKALGLAAVILSAAFLAFLLVTMAWNGAGGFKRTEIALTLDFPAMHLPVDAAQLKSTGADLALASADLEGAVQKAENAAYTSPVEPGTALFSDSAWLTVRDALKADPTLLQRKQTFWLPASTMIEEQVRNPHSPQSQGADKLRSMGWLRTGFNWDFLTASNSTDPTVAGIWGALKGSLLTMLVTFAIAFPVGLFAAIYLEEYAPRNRWTDLIEVSINNLAAVPSIIFGLVGPGGFLHILNVPRLASLVR